MMSIIRSVVVAALLMTTLVGAAVGPAFASGRTTWYVSLGDSAAAGFQPNGQFDRGYADQLYFRAQSRFEHLRLVKLGCPGETSVGLISGLGSVCPYPAGSQLNQARRFLVAHRGQVVFITINIGVNDVLFLCQDPIGLIHLACVHRVMPRVQANVAYIIEALRAAAPGVSIAGMSYWDPFLGYWLIGPGGHRLARADEQAMEAMNAGLVSAYAEAGALVADVAGPPAFDISNFTDFVLTKWGRIPVNVANACTWTWFCAPPPLGLDPHPNTRGYAVIADAFAAVLFDDHGPG